MRKTKSVDEILDMMYSNPEFCPITNDKEICKLRELNFDCSDCYPELRKQFSGEYIESGGKVCRIPEIKPENKTEAKNSVNSNMTLIENKDLPSIIIASNEEKEDPVEEPVIDLSTNPILLVDNRGIIGIYDNSEKATNSANDIIVAGNSEEIIVYKPYKKVARSTRIDDL